MTKVVVNGAEGKMGKVTVATIEAADDLLLVAALGCKDDLGAVIKQTAADVVIDFTTPDSVYHNTRTIIEHRARPVIGTTGLTLEQIDDLSRRCHQQRLGGVITPNFSIAAILMMRFSEQAAALLPNVEIIEMHHPQKKDAPSGTAKTTAARIATARDDSAMMAAHSHGHEYQGVPIHSVRLPGFFAHQKVIFGDKGESLTIAHDCFSREAMMPGVLLATRQVMHLEALLCGIETLFEKEGECVN